MAHTNSNETWCIEIFVYINYGLKKYSRVYNSTITMTINNLVIEATTIHIKNNMLKMLAKISMIAYASQ
jgi:hypothetical protein